MNLFRRCSSVTAIFLCAALALGGCGKEEHGSPSGGRADGQSSAVSDTEERMAYKDMRYLPEFTDTSERFGAYTVKSAGFLNDTFYLIKGNRSEYGYYLSDCRLTAYHPDTGEETILLDEEGGEGRMLTAAPMEDGSLFVLFKTGGEVFDPGYRLCRLDSEGNESFSREYPDLSFPEGDRDVRFAADSQGRCCLLAGDELLFFDRDGKALGKADLSGKTITRLACGGDGKVYLHELYTNCLIPVDFGTVSLGTDSCPVPIGTLSAAGTADAADFLICDTTTVYRYFCEDGGITPLFDLQDSQIFEASSIDVIGEMKDGRVFVFSRDERLGTTEAALLTPTPIDECPVKEVVTIGTVYPDTDLLDNVVRFNRQNGDFNVSIVNYRVGGRSYSEASEALKLDISIGKGPDLCDLGAFEDQETLFAAGCFEDLSGYLNESGQYDKEDFIPQALDTCTYEDQLMAIPKYFRLQTIAGKSDIVGDTPGWNLDDLKAVVEGHPDAAMIFETMPGSYIFDVCLRNMMDEYVDFGRNKARFDSPDYISFLDFVKDLPDGFNENECWSHGDEWLQEERALLSVREIRRFTDLQEMEAAFGEPYTCIGYPAPDREPDCVIKGFGAYAVSAASAHKDKAWQFLEWNLSTQGEEKYDSTLRSGFPTRADVFRQEMEKASDTEPLTAFFAGGSMVKHRRITPEEIGLLDSLVKCAGPEKGAEETILEIMEEEAAYLFDGSKTAEETAEVIQNRVQLYLDER